MTVNTKTPPGLAAGGRTLWRQLLERDPSLAEESNPNRVLAVEVCRAKDLADRLHRDLRACADLSSREANVLLSRQTSNATLLKQLVISLRLPDEATGKRPQRHTGPATRTPSDGKTSSRLRLASNG